MWTLAKAVAHWLYKARFPIHTPSHVVKTCWSFLASLYTHIRHTGERSSLSLVSTDSSVADELRCLIPVLEAHDEQHDCSVSSIPGDVCDLPSYTRTELESARSLLERRDSSCLHTFFLTFWGSTWGRESFLYI